MLFRSPGDEASSIPALRRRSYHRCSMPILTVRDSLYCHTDDGKYDSYDGRWNRSRKTVPIPDAGLFRSVRTRVTTSNGDNQHETITERRPVDAKIIDVILEIRVEPHRPLGENHWCGVEIEIDVDMPALDTANSDSAAPSEQDSANAFLGGGAGDGPTPFGRALMGGGGEDGPSPFRHEVPTVRAQPWTVEVHPSLQGINLEAVRFDPPAQFEPREGDTVVLALPPHHPTFVVRIQRRTFNVSRLCVVLDVVKVET